MRGGNAADAVAAAESQIGKPYAWAQPISPRGSNPPSFDCSGLAMWAWWHAGVRPALPHFSVAQQKVTRKRPLSDVQPGDLVFFRSAGVVYHVAVYVGNGQIVEAPTYGVPVRYRSVNASTADIMHTVGMFPGTGTGASSGGLGLTGSGYDPSNPDKPVSLLQLASYAHNAGFRGADVPIAVAVALAESGGIPSKVNTNNRDGSTDRGVWQINSVHSDLPGYAQWEDPGVNARLAYAVWKEQGWHGWTTYNSGAYLPFLGRAKAVSKSLTPPVPVRDLHIPLTVDQRVKVLAFIETGAVNGDVQPDGFAMALITGTLWTTYKNDPTKLTADRNAFLKGNIAWDASAIHEYKLAAKGTPEVPAGYKGDLITTSSVGWIADIEAAFTKLNSAAFWQRVGLFVLGGTLTAFSVKELVKEA